MKPVTRNNTTSLVTALGLSAGLIALPAISQAEDGLSTGMNVASMYLWRGQDLSQPGPAVSGNVDYNIAGLTVGTWASSEGVAGSYELDAYISYALELGPVGLSFGLTEYMYPELAGSVADTDFSEWVVGFSVADFGATVYKHTQLDDTYVSLDYALGKIGLHVGKYSFEAPDSDYIDMNVSYAMTDSASVTISKTAAEAVVGMENDALVMFSYDIPL